MHRPSQLIDEYNAWEIELDFGVLPDDTVFLVGHDGPAPKFGLNGLGDWIVEIMRSGSIDTHPIILKLEAKTHNTCDDPTCIICCWHWAPGVQWGNWELRLRKMLQGILGDHWLTRKEFMNVLGSRWPFIKALKGRVIIELLDSHDGRDINDPNSEWFFQVIPSADLNGLEDTGVRSSKRIANPTDFGRSIVSGFQRLVMDEQYICPWSNVFNHPPMPLWVSDNASTWCDGTRAKPFGSLDQAVNALHTFSGLPLTGEVILINGKNDGILDTTVFTLLEKSTNLTAHRLDTATYTVYIVVGDVDHAGTKDPIQLLLAGEFGKSVEITIDKTFHWLERAAIQRIWITSQFLGELSSIAVSVIGGDEVFIDKIIVQDPSAGRYISIAPAWVGSKEKMPTVFQLNR